MFKKIRTTIKGYKLSNLNFRLILYVLAVTFIGIFCIGSAAEGENFQMKQIIGFILGLIVLTFFALLSYKLLFKFYWIVYFTTIVLLMLVIVLGTVNKGAKRWIDLGFTQFQPSELAKIFLIIFIATYLFKRIETLNTFKTIGGIVLFVGIVLDLYLLNPIYQQQ